MLKRIEDIQQKVVEQLNVLATQDLQTQVDTLENIKSQWLGKKSELSAITKEMKQASVEEKREIGKRINDIRTLISDRIAQSKILFEQLQLQKKLEQESIDVTLPGRKTQTGTQHILSRVLEQLEDLFISMGYQVVEGPEIESDEYNFGKMNLPKDHPARDMQDTFYITSDILMRTQTSPVQARTMEKHDFTKGPLKMISPGKVYRRDDDDATHSHQFQQIEGLVISENITMSDLKGTLEVVAKHMFGQDRTIRLRPSYFPFTEPSVEVDVSCFKCNGTGCSVCKQTGWIEVLGAGMVHPNVLEMSGVDSSKYSGFAFGLGVERFAMLKYGVDDIRHFYQNDVRFLNQFSIVLEGEK